MTYTIKKGSPSDLFNARTTKYGFEKMKPGTYIDIPSNDPAAQRNASGGCPASSAAASYAKRHDKKFVTRRLPTGTFRIYCVNKSLGG